MYETNFLDASEEDVSPYLNLKDLEAQKNDMVKITNVNHIMYYNLYGIVDQIKKGKNSMTPYDSYVIYFPSLRGKKDAFGLPLDHKEFGYYELQRYPLQIIKPFEETTPQEINTHAFDSYEDVSKK